MTKDQEFKLASDAQYFRYWRSIVFAVYAVFAVAIVFDNWRRVEELKIEAAKAGVPAPSSVGFWLSVVATIVGGILLQTATQAVARAKQANVKYDPSDRQH